MDRWDSRVRRRLLPDSRDSRALALVVVIAGVAVYAIATWLFPHHSINHDEAVYLQQAEMLLGGKLRLDPAVPGAVRPWFFVQDGTTLYAKYTPVTAALYAPALAVGTPRIALAVIGATNVALVGLLASEAFEARAAPLAAALFAAAPLSLLSSSVFLSYAPTTLLTLLFALSYVRALRRESRLYAALAGIGVGLAFFSRPLTALLFAAPFIGHAMITLAIVWRGDLSGAIDRTTAVGLTARLGTVAGLGSAFVALALAYNWTLTGDPMVFPYEAFAPSDGIGFGRRQILDHARHYEPELALRANGLVLWAFFTRWGPLGVLGTGLAAVGVVTGLLLPLWRRWHWERSRSTGGSWRPLNGVSCRALLAGVAVTVSGGNVFFWGNLNILGDIGNPTDGLLAYLGPFYHVDLLVPVAVFGAGGTLVLVERVQKAIDRSVRRASSADGTALRRAMVAGALVSALLVAGGAEAVALGPAVERNAEYRDEVAQAYEPFASTQFENALVFVPTPYGEWLNHPFQRLRNDPSFDGNAVYVLDRDANADAATLAAFDDRQPYRFTYRGRWPPRSDDLQATLQPLLLREGNRLRIRTRVGVVADGAATLRLATNEGSVLYGLPTDGDTETVEWVVEQGRVRVADEGLRRYSDQRTVPLDGPSEVTLAVTFTEPGGGSVTYRQELTVVETHGRVRALWPPQERVCQLTTDCGRQGTYLEGGEYPSGVSLAASVEETHSTG
jgi:hypothetical protein